LNTKSSTAIKIEYGSKLLWKFGDELFLGETSVDGSASAGADVELVNEFVSVDDKIDCVNNESVDLNAAGGAIDVTEGVENLKGKNTRFRAANTKSKLRSAPKSNVLSGENTDDPGNDWRRNAFGKMHIIGIAAANRAGSCLDILV